MSSGWEIIVSMNLAVVVHMDRVDNYNQFPWNFSQWRTTFQTWRLWTKRRSRFPRCWTHSNPSSSGPAELLLCMFAQRTNFCCTLWIDCGFLLYGNSLSSSSLPHLTHCDILWFSVTPSFRIMVPSSPLVLVDMGDDVSITSENMKPLLSPFLQPPCLMYLQHPSSGFLFTVFVDTALTY